MSSISRRSVDFMHGTRAGSLKDRGLIGPRVVLISAFLGTI